MTQRRLRTAGTLLVLLIVLVGTVTPVAATGDAGVETAATGNAPADTSPRPGWTVVPQTNGSDAPTIHQRGVVTPNDEPGSVSLTFEYEIPPAVDALRVGIPVVAVEGVSVASTDGFEQTGGGLFLWDGETETPSVTLDMAVADRRVRGAQRDDWSLVFEPRTRIQVQTAASPVQTNSFEVADGVEGHASGSIAYLGPHDRRDATVADEEVTFILATEDADPSRAIEFLRTANEHFDFGVQRDSLTVFVLPNEESTEGPEPGTTIDTAMVLTERSLRFDDSGSVFAHEYVHTRFGTLGRGSAAWLTEAHAEYYGRLFTFNDGVGTYESFREGLRASEYGEDGRAVTLSEPDTWEGTTGHYDKGAHVLAALDAQIRERTDGERTLRDVFEGRTQPFPGYQTFKLEVIEVAGDESIGEWLDRYVTTDALPPLPDDPRYYVAEPSLDPDGDGMSSGEEIEQGRHPFVEGEGELPARGNSTATATAESTEGGAPGFGVPVAVLAVVVAAVVRRRG